LEVQPEPPDLRDSEKDATPLSSLLFDTEVLESMSQSSPNQAGDLGSPRAVLSQASNSATEQAPNLEEPTEEVLTSEGLRKIMGTYLTLYTDLDPARAVDEIPKVFDLAVPQWAHYFGIELDRLNGWHLIGCLMKEPDRFRRVRLFTDGLPPFKNGFHLGRQIWVYDQPTDYYRRHLVLHEGVHAIMRQRMGGTGPPWFREGMAEHLATHRWSAGKLRVAMTPRRREDVSGWGRIEAMRRAFQRGQARMLREVWGFPNEAFNEDEAYAWCWGAVAYLDGHPQFRKRFRSMLERVADETITFTQQLQLLFIDELRELDEQWQIFISGIDYGYDFRRNAVEYGPGKPLPAEGGTVAIRTDRGWQSTGIRLEKGKTYRLTATGRFQVALERGQPWISEAGGVTLRYYRGLPLGMLAGNIRLDQSNPGLASLTSPFPLGRSREICPMESGTLYLLVNDHPAEYTDNAGTLQVSITSKNAEPAGDKPGVSNVRSDPR
jgi:hypothetical protein